MFDLPDSGCFEELLSRGDGEDEQKIMHFLNVVSGEEAPSALFFFKNIREEEVEVEIPVGTFSCSRKCICCHSQCKLTVSNDFRVPEICSSKFKYITLLTY